MNTRNQKKIKTVLTLAAVAMSIVGLMGTSASAEVIFTESFENPDLTFENTRTPGRWVLKGYNNDGNRWPGWVAGGFKYVGIEDTSLSVAGSESFINSFGDQVAYVFDNLPGGSTDASLTTKSDSLNATLAANTIYTLTFNMASGASGSINYHVELLAMAGSVETILGSAAGPIASYDLAANVGSIVLATGDTHDNLGDRIAIRLRKGNGYYTTNIYYDNIILTADPVGFSPEEGEVVSAGNVGLRWTNMAPVTPPVYVDVWFGTNPESLTQVVTGGADMTTFTVNAPVVGQTYYWQVNSYINGSPTGDPIEGAVHSFITADLPPSSVDAGTDMIAWSGHMVQLAATVEDDGASNLTYAWTAEPAAGVLFSATDVEDPTVTITKAAGDAETVTLTLAVHDAGNPASVTDTVTIDVYDNACQAGRVGKWLLPDNPTDCDGNCITNLKDFSIVAGFWLRGNQLEELALVAEAWLGDYSPTANLLNDIQLEKENENELLSAISALKDHITGTAPLDDGQIETYKWAIDDLKDIFGSNETIIAACFDLVDTYDDVIGPIFVAGSPKAGGFNRSDAITGNDIHWAVYCTMQHILDITYTEKNILRYPDLFDGYKYKCSATFPGAVDPPADPEDTHTVTINGSYLEAWGHNTMYTTSPARKPTGTYLSPGTIATVMVPLSIVGKGYTVRVGAHTWNLSGKSSVKRMDRCTLAYSIDSAEVKVANPLGGSIYIEVPYKSDGGIVDVQIKNAVRSPYFSAKSFHSTTLAEWQNTERHHPGPWADFQSEKFIMTVPTSWIYAYNDPVTVMAKWDAAMDAMNDLMGFPHDRGKETMYPHVDVLLRANFFAPGYPSGNIKYNSTGTYNGNQNTFLLTGPENAPNYLFHEEGHAYLFQKFPGETNESAVNLHHVAVQHQACGKTLDAAFRASRGYGSFATLDTTAITWMTVFNFSPKEEPMADGEKAYQLKGHAKYVEIARLFGWQALNDFWYELNYNNEHGIPSDTSTDGQILRFSQKAGADLRPLFHFWGTHPQYPAALEATIASENLPASVEIYDMLVHYKSLVPADNLAFQAFALNWWGHQPNIGGYWTEREHTRQWDSTSYWQDHGWDYMGTDVNQADGEIYTEATCARIKAVVDGLIALYFPDKINPPTSRVTGEASRRLR